MADASTILRARARALAQPLTDPRPDTALLELLEFRLAQERYAVETRYVAEVYPLKDLTRMPCTPAFVAGIVNVRGRIVSVLDFRKFFRLPEHGLTDLHRIVIIHGNDMEFGLLADVTLGVRSTPLETVQPPLPTLTRIGSQYLKGLTGDHLIILDAPRILADPQIIIHEEVEN